MSRFKFWSGDMAEATPVYVTRQTASGLTGALSLSIWMQLLVIFLVWFNIVGWGIYGLVELVTKIV